VGAEARERFDTREPELAFEEWREARESSAGRMKGAR
jgi:hypothetical protein